MSPKPLSDFPRPPHDNGRGVHWSASLYHPSGEDLRFWIQELQAMQIKWVKILDDGGGSSLDLARALLDHGIMPVVRIYRERPNPGHLGGRETEAVERLIQAGVHYFETNNEPDLPAEWQNNHRPANWLDIVVDNFIIDADIILDAGGLPAVPAMGPGSKDNIIARVAERGRVDIFESGAWLAIHNYTLNHPLDYPYDPVNQQGQPLTQEEYERLAAWQYSHLTPEEAEAKGVSRDDYFKFQRWAWDGRSLEEINQLRAEAQNPGHTIFDDANCFRAWEFWGQLVFDTLGFYIPVISTEGGPVVGWGDDRRYAKVNPTTQAAWQLEIVRFLQDEAPEWYFTCCTWLLASKPLGDFSPTWDQMSWYTHAWDLQFGLNGELPIVQLLKDTPAQVRHELRKGEDAPGRVLGRVTDRTEAPVVGLTLELRREDHIFASTQTDGDGRYALEAPAGTYDLYVPWYGPASHSISLDPGDTDTVDLSGFDNTGTYHIAGVARDDMGQPQAGLEVELHRNGLSHAVTTTAGDGSFAFELPLAGEYALVAGRGVALAKLDPARPRADVELIVPQVPEPRYVVVRKRLLDREETGNRHLFYGRVLDEQGEGMSGIELEMRWTDPAPGTTFPRTRTGQDPSKPAGYYEFLNSAGEFEIQVVQGDYESEVADGLVTTGIPGREGEPITYEVDFQLMADMSALPSASVVRGHVPGGRQGQAVHLWKSNEKTASLQTTLDAGLSFRFADLPAGLYDLELSGIGTIRSELALDGDNEVEITFPIQGAIIGRVQNLRPGQRSITLISETYGFVRRGQLTPEGQYRFTNLPAGVYRLEVGDAVLPGLRCDGTRVLAVPVFAVPAGEPAHNSIIEGTVLDSDGHPVADLVVLLRTVAETIATDTTGADGRFRFENLGAGVYQLVIAGVVAAQGLVLDGENTVTQELHYTPVASMPKTFQRYYLLGTSDAALMPELVRLVGNWISSQPGGVLGFDPREARLAETVVLLGDGISDETVSELQAAGCRTEDLRQDLLSLAETLTPSPPA
ncbi:MAG: carboxypeptidase regulatory-like domain-containing protein [Caldilineae bacterium]|nr:MAG: carboxypeptidase regulatory-like domain-containing protein [Caldilineae bacterium]